MSTAAYITVMAITTYLIRAVPFAAFGKKIKSRFWKSFFDYIPYTVLAAMTFPSIFYSTGDVFTAAAGTAAAVILAYFDMPLIVVAAAAAGAAFIAGLFF